MADADQLRAVLHALSDAGRLRIVRMLADADTDLACSVLNQGMPRSTASYHFTALRECGLISQYDRGNQRYNRIEWERMERVAPGLLRTVLDAARREGATGE